jgi:hypothetical protein
MWKTIQREIRVATSRRAQPVAFRLVKWAVIVTLTALFWRERAYWYCLAGVTPVAVAVHLLYRMKTRRWTRPWGGWNDPDAGR